MLRDVPMMLLPFLETFKTSITWYGTGQMFLANASQYPELATALISMCMDIQPEAETVPLEA